MNLWNKTLPILGALALSTGCIGADDDPNSSDTDDPTSGGMTTMAPTTMTTVADDTADDTAGTMGGTMDDTAGTADTGMTDTEGSSSTGPDPTVFQFSDADVTDYVQLDRKGFPAINTGLNILGDKEAYNASNPAEDISMSTAEDNAVASLVTLHVGPPGAMVANNTGLDDELIPTYEPCSVIIGGGDDCFDQVAPFAFPDTLNLQLGNEEGFPNGRALDTQVMDIILAVVLLDLATEGLFRFLDLDDDGTLGDSVNPFTNDVMFQEDWPYLAPPHEP